MATSPRKPTASPTRPAVLAYYGIGAVLLVGLGVLIYLTRDSSRGAWYHPATYTRQVSAAEMVSKINSLSHLAAFLGQQVAEGQVRPQDAARQLNAGLVDARGHWDRYIKAIGPGASAAREVPASKESVEQLFAVVEESIPLLEAGKLTGLDRLQSVGNRTAAD